MMGEHEGFDSRIQMTEAAPDAYRAYLGFHLTNEESLLKMAETGEGELAGFCLATINRNLPMFLPPRYGYLSDLVVAPSMRRRGIGRQLVHAVVQWLGQEGIESIQLQVYSQNQDGAQFWKAMGFHSYYDRMWFDLP